jgi:hypothetical protein
MQELEEFDSLDFDPGEWDIRREGHPWSGERFERRIYQALRKLSLLVGFLSMKQND